MTFLLWFQKHNRRSFFFVPGAMAVATASLLAGCPDDVTTTTTTTTSTSTASSSSGSTTGEIPDSGYPDVSPTSGTFCKLPGAVIFDALGKHVVPGGETLPDLTWLHLPDGFCAHYFANVPNTRQMRFAPGGELFVASPVTSTTGGGPNGLAGIAVLPDDDKDGLADSKKLYLGQLPSTQGLLFDKGYFYYQDDTRIRRVPYKAGDRTGQKPGDVVVDIQIYVSQLHWPKTLDVADDGTIYVANGGDQGEVCDPSHPFHGGILKIDGTPGGTPVTRGYRNPIAVRCQRGHNNCFASELALDYSGMQGGREKLVPIHAGDDIGFPCCASKDTPYGGIVPTPDCSKVASELGSFIIGDTPFGIEFDLGAWPAPWKNNIFVPLHGEFGSWEGARLVAITTYPSTGLAVPATDLMGHPTESMKDFATGWDDGFKEFGRPAAVAMSDDGRLFVGNDVTGDIFWIAPVGME
jgi:glucose/arabinose dehydrogenase